MSADPQSVAPETALAALIDWYTAIGVDVVVDPWPHDRFAEGERSSDVRNESAEPAALDADSSPPPVVGIRSDTAPIPAGAAKSDRPAGRRVEVFPEHAARAAEEAASAAASLADLRARLEAFDGCPLKGMASHFVFAAGKPGARVMVLDFAPGEEEERSGEAFVGAGGRLLDNMLAPIGCDRETAYLAYFSPWRPPGGQPPSAQVMASLIPFARRHIELARPETLLIMGESAGKALLGPSEIARLRGAWFDYPCGEANVRAALLPSLESLLKAPTLKRRAWTTLRSLGAPLSR